MGHNVTVNWQTVEPFPGKKCVIEADPRWYECQLPQLERDGQKELTVQEISILQAQARTLLYRENKTFEVYPPKNDNFDRKFIKAMMKGGTLIDKISALTLHVQSSPLHTIKVLEQLISMGSSKNTREALMALSNLRELVVDVLLPNRKLRFFSEQPLGSRGQTDKHLIVWEFEDYLKRAYFNYILCLETVGSSPLEHSRKTAVLLVEELLEEKPEQERNLLRLLIRKLADKTGAVSSKATFLVLKLLVRHPNMKAVIVREASDFVLRPGAGFTVIRGAATTLNQFVLSHQDADAANQLVEFYFKVFDIILVCGREEAEAGFGGGKKRVPSKKQRRLRASNKHTEPTSVDTRLSYEQQNKLLSMVLTGVVRAFPFAKIDAARYKEHMAMLFRIVQFGLFDTGVRALTLIYQIMAREQLAYDRFYRSLYRLLLHPQLCRTSKKALFFNLVFKVLREDTANSRVMAFVKRLCQIAGHYDPSLTCGVLYLVGELVQSNPLIKALVVQPEENNVEEHFVDQDSVDQDSCCEDGGRSGEGGEETAKRPSSPVLYYDGREECPDHAHAERSCLWELALYAEHYHPAVAAHGKHLLRCEAVPTPPHLHLYTLTRFLDRFAYRVPKQGIRPKGCSYMQVPLHELTTPSDKLVWRKGGGITAPGEKVANTEEFRQQQSTRVSPEDVFLYKYFTEAAPEKTKHKNPKGEGHECMGETQGDLFEDDELWGEVGEDSETLGEDGGMDSEEEAAEEVSVDGSPSGDLSGDSCGEGSDGLPDAAEKPMAGSSATKKGRKKRKLADRLPLFAAAEEYSAILEGRRTSAHFSADRPRHKKQIPRGE